MEIYYLLSLIDLMIGPKAALTPDEAKSIFRQPTETGAFREQIPMTMGRQKTCGILKGEG
jgi:hypothetical protein